MNYNHFRQRVNAYDTTSKYYQNHPAAMPMYRCEPYQEKNRQPLTFPKDLLENEVHRIRQFHDQKQLYYYLTWTAKLQLIDGEFTLYTFQHSNPGQIIVFNAEIHDADTNEGLFVVAVPIDCDEENKRNSSQWAMDRMMTAKEIGSELGIFAKDLPVGSRLKHNYFKEEMAANERSLCQHQLVGDWSRVQIERPQQYKNEVNPCLDDVDLNGAIAASIDEIENGSLSLMSVLRIDRKRERIHCVPLIPVKIPNESKWIAVSYKSSSSSPYRIAITSIYINCFDIISKASLVDPNAVFAYHWLTGEHVQCQQRRQKEQESQKEADRQKEVNSMLRQQLAEAYRIQQAQQKQIHDRLQSELSLLSLLHQKDQQIHALNMNRILSSRSAVNNLPILSLLSSPSTPVRLGQLTVTVPPVTPIPSSSNLMSFSNVSVTSSPSTASPMVNGLTYSMPNTPSISSSVTNSTLNQ